MKNAFLITVKLLDRRNFLVVMQDSYGHYWKQTEGTVYPVKAWGERVKTKR